MTSSDKTSQAGRRRPRGESATAATIGFVGLGAMGSRLAGRLLDAGQTVHGTNRTKAKAESLIGRGLIWHDTPREVAEEAGVVFSMVTDDDALLAITSGADGIVAGLAPETVYADMSTVSPEASRRIAELVAARGATMLDAPVSGSVPAAEAGALTIMVGGPDHAFARVAPILSRLGTKVTRIGGNGSGLLMKLAVNISLAEQMLAFSEGVLLAEQGGIDRKLAVSILTESPLGSPMLKSRGPLVLDLPAEAWFDVALMRKDLQLALRAANAFALPLPSASVANELYTAADAMGYEDQDIAVVYEVLAELAGQ